MNRIRKYGDIYQVILTPDMIVSPDSSLLLGGFTTFGGTWMDQDVHNFKVLNFNTLQDAQCESFNHPDIDWHKITMNHKYIYMRLQQQIQHIIKTSNINVQFLSHLMTADEFKNSMFAKTLNNTNSRVMIPDIISFTIINPWTENLKRLSNYIQTFREHLYRDDLRIRQKKTIQHLRPYSRVNAASQNFKTYETLISPHNKK